MHGFMISLHDIPRSLIQHFDMFKLRIFRIDSADIVFFIYFDISTFILYLF